MHSLSQFHINANNFLVYIKCNFNVHNDYKFAMCKKLQWNYCQGNLHILTMKVNEEDDDMQTFKPLHNLK